MRILSVILGLGIGLGYTIAVASAQEATQANDSQPAAAQERNVPQVTEDKPMNFWMAKKLEYSKAILESLTVGKFDQLATEADRMRLLGKMEGFVRRKNPAYRTQQRMFDVATQELIRHSKRKDAAGAALAFNQLTNSCVACHVLLREGLE